MDDQLRLDEISTLRSRQMVRDSLEETADKVYAKLSAWPKYVDVERWLQLLEWLENHPQRVTSWDEQLIELDGRLEQLEKFPISHTPIKRRRGPHKGSTISPERRAKQSIAMKRKWEEWKKDGTSPAVGRPPKLEPQEDEAPY